MKEFITDSKVSLALKSFFENYITFLKRGHRLKKTKNYFALKNMRDYLNSTNAYTKTQKQMILEYYQKKLS